MWLNIIHTNEWMQQIIHHHSLAAKTTLTKVAWHCKKKPPTLLKPKSPMNDWINEWTTEWTMFILHSQFPLPPVRINSYLHAYWGNEAISWPNPSIPSKRTPGLRCKKGRKKKEQLDHKSVTDISSKVTQQMIVKMSDIIAPPLNHSDGSLTGHLHLFTMFHI